MAEYQAEKLAFASLTLIHIRIAENKKTITRESDGEFANGGMSY